MIIELRMERMKVIPKKSKSFKLPEQILSKMTPGTSIILYPGANKVNDTDWTAAKIICSKNIERSIKYGKLKVITEGEKTKVKASTIGKKDKKIEVEADIEKSKSINDLTPKAAKKLIKNCNNMETIKSWLEECKVDDIRYALEKRKKEIEKYFEDFGKDDSNDDDDINDDDYFSEK